MAETITAPLYDEETSRKTLFHDVSSALFRYLDTTEAVADALHVAEAITTDVLGDHTLAWQQVITVLGRTVGLRVETNQ